MARGGCDGVTLKGERGSEVFTAPAQFSSSNFSTEKFEWKSSTIEGRRLVAPYEIVAGDGCVGK